MIQKYSSVIVSFLCQETCDLSYQPGVVRVNWSIKTTSPGLLVLKMLFGAPFVLQGLCVTLPYKHPVHCGILNLVSFASNHPIA